LAQICFLTFFLVLSPYMILHTRAHKVFQNLLRRGQEVSRKMADHQNKQKTNK
jgi:hypothetical protein